MVDRETRILVLGVVARANAQGEPVTGGLIASETQLDAGAYHEALAELVRDGLIAAAAVGGDGHIIDWTSLRATAEGRSVLESHRTGAPAVADDDVIAHWNALRRWAESNPTLADEIDETTSDLEDRGLFRSGRSIVLARRIGARYELQWSPKKGAFVATWRRRLKPWLMWGLAVLGVAVAALAYWAVDSDKETAAAISSAATALAAFGALIGIVRRDG